jgi:dTDP-4-dehydrorhamnose reductase
VSATQPVPVLEPAGAAAAARLPRYGGRLLVTGASGFVGRNLTRAFRWHHLVAVTGFEHPILPGDVGASTRRESVDVRDPRSMARLIAELAPDAVIHLAGNKNVRFCEQHPAEADAINRGGTEHVAEACLRVGARLVYVSTDLVFDGDRGGYREDSIPRPGTVYGRTKLAGEVAAATADRRALICRTGGLYGAGSPLLGWLRDELEAGRPVEAFQDVVSTPTSTDDLARGIDVALALGLTGILHVVGRQAVSRYEWFSLFASVFGYDRQGVIPAVAGARRRELLLPRDISLDARASQQRLNFEAVGPRAGLERLFHSEGGR